MHDTSILGWDSDIFRYFRLYVREKRLLFVEPLYNLLISRDISLLINVEDILKGLSLTYSCRRQPIAIV